MVTQSQKGNILVASLLILLTMCLLGAGLMQSSAREYNVSSLKTIDSEVFHITETCSHDVMHSFESLTAKPTSVDDVTVQNLDSMLTGDETQKEQNKLAGYSYNCVTTYLLTKNSTSSATSGEQIGNSGGEYGGTGTVPKDYYQIVSTGSGPKSASKMVTTIISVEY